MNLSTVEAFKNVKHSEGVSLEGELLRKYQLALLQIAEDIIDVCESENINYCLLGGSALGAVRHQGFIPWDDDMDMGILDDDMERFSAAFLKKHSDKYYIHNCRTKEYGINVDRVRLKNSICRCREDIGNQECGFFVDIFRIVNTPDNAILRNLHGFFCMASGFMLSCRNFYRNRQFMLEIANQNESVKKAFYTKIAIGFLVSFIPTTTMTIWTQNIYSICKNGNSKYVSIPSGRKHYFGELYLRKDFVETTEAEFEGHRWKLPKNYEMYFKCLYKDWRKIPKEEEREKHVYMELKFPDEMITGGGGINA